jgi:hypothetical protein
MSSSLPVSSSLSALSDALAAAGHHVRCRGCKEPVLVSKAVATVGWHTVHACTPEQAIEVNVREAGAEPWAWRYAADAVAASIAQVAPAKRRPGTRPS